MMAGLETFGRFAKNYSAGEMIFSEFEPGDTFYFIQSGRVELVKILGNVEKILDILQPNDMFGEMAILENSARSATAIALDDVTLLEFNRQTFEVLMQGNPQIALRLLRMFTKRIYDTKRRYMTLTLEDPEARVADVFIMLDESLPDLKRSTESREFPVKTDDIARWAGLSAAQAKQALDHFASQRRIELKTDTILVKNINEYFRFVNSRRRR
jgi:CRP-like cAMP-binding protein